MPTVSAARGCSPTARLRRPQRVRNSAIWKTMTMTISDDGDRALAEERVEEPADDRQVGQAFGRVRTP